MKNVKKKLFSFIICLSLIFTCAPANIAHAGAGEVLEISLTGLGLLSNVLETFFPLIVKATDDSAINNGDYKEILSFLPPDFAQDRFFITAYDGINPNNSSLTWRIKAYLESNPNNPTEVTLKSGQEFSVRTDFQTSNMIFEFYNGNETSPFERYYLPYEKQNLNYGIALGCNKKTYYLQKETGRVFNETVMNRLFNYPFPSRYEDCYNGLYQSDKQKYDPIIFQKTKRADKANMSNASYVDNQSILNLLNEWKNPGHVVIPRPIPVISFPYSIEGENFIDKSPYASITEMWYGKEVWMQIAGDYALYKVYIPDTGYYGISYQHVLWDTPAPVELSEADTGQIYDTATLKAYVDSNYGMTNSLGNMVWLTKGMHIFKLTCKTDADAIIDKINFDQISFFEQFDRGVSSWNVGKGTPSTATPPGYNDNFLSYNLNEDTDVIYKTFSSPQRNKVTMYLYDDASKPSCHAMGNVSNGWNDGNTFVSIGIDSAKSTSKYVVRLGANTYVTNVNRTTGFHKLKWDYGYASGVQLYIDDILVWTNTTFKTYNNISLGDWWQDNITSNGIYFDSVSFDYQ